MTRQNNGKSVLLFFTLEFNYRKFSVQDLLCSNTEIIEGDRAYNHSYIICNVLSKNQSKIHHFPHEPTRLGCYFFASTSNFFYASNRLAMIMHVGW